MEIARFLKATILVGIISACIFVVTACSGEDPNSGVAATVNGEEISEQSVTDEVNHVRAQSGLSDDEQWGKFLVQNDMTPEKVREDVIDNMVEKLLIQRACADLDIVVEDTEVDEAINKFKENYSSDESWKNALEQAGFTEESYRQNINGSMTEKKVGEYFEEQVEVTDDDYVSSAKTYASYYDGAKRSSHILFKVEDANDTEALSKAKSEAESVLQRIKDGSLDFAEAAKQYSGDEGSAEEGGDVGWDKLNSFVEEYTTALGDLEEGQVSDPVESQYGVHIIKVTEVFNAPEKDDITSLDQIPEAFRKNIQDMAVSVKANTLYTDWLAEVKETAEIEINPMPKGLPYDIDLTKYQEEKDKKDAENDEAGTPIDDTADTSEATDDGVIDQTIDETLVDDTADGTEVLDASAEIVEPGTDAAADTSTDTAGDTAADAVTDSASTEAPAE